MLQLSFGVASCVYIKVLPLRGDTVVFGCITHLWTPTGHMSTPPRVWILVPCVEDTKCENEDQKTPRFSCEYETIRWLISIGHVSYPRFGILHLPLERS